MRNEPVYDIDDDDGSDNDSDDSDYDADDDDNNDDNYDDFIAGVDIPQVNPPDPPAEIENADEENQQLDNEDNEQDDIEQDDDNDGDNEQEDDNDDGDNEQEEAATATEVPAITPLLKQLTDTAGALPPILDSRTRQQTGVILVAGATEDEQQSSQPLNKKPRKIERELQKQMLKRAEIEENKRLKNKLENERRRTKSRRGTKHQMQQPEKNPKSLMNLETFAIN